MSQPRPAAARAKYRGAVDYRLESLTSASFEQLVQALAVKHLDVGVVPYGPGPDGGRDASFRGRPRNSPGSTAWDGEVWIQAKFLQSLRSTATDQRWVIAQLRRELRTVQRRRAAGDRVDYYVFATNVTLTSTRGTGGKDRVARLLREAGFADFAIWDHRKLCVLLDDAPEIRTAYAAWITPGDVLAATFARLTRMPDLPAAMSKLLQADVIADRFANLEQAGHRTDELIPMARVFTDLPVAVDEQQRSFLELIMEAGNEPLRNSMVGQQRGDAAQRRPGRHVLLGGPGQGKTTLSQFACQLFRAALLRDLPSSVLDDEAIDALSEIEIWCRENDLRLPDARRYPFHIPLASLAAALKSPDRQVTSVLGYIRTRICDRFEIGLEVQDLREWLRVSSWLVVFDGLDEVPASANRRALMQVVKEFMVEIASADADVLVLATSRLQGYQDDFSPRRFHHATLCPLEPSEALVYGERVASARFARTSERYERVITRLADAVEDDTTAHLTTSPLQITIMVLLLDRGKAPEERWTLFRDYYELLYARERDRDHPISEVLRQHKPSIDVIHQRVALDLQIAADEGSDDGTDLRIPSHRFAEIVDARLISEGHEGWEKSELTSRITEAAELRLVFLTGITQGKVGFEVRSLQEFFAAEGLLAGPQEIVLRRLSAIAAADSWFNVLMFAIGRCFANPTDQHMREEVVALCRTLDERDPHMRAVRFGAGVALAILREGIVRRQPRFARLLSEHAIELIDVTQAGVHAELAAAYTLEMREVFEPTLSAALVHRSGADAVSIWICLLSLASGEVGWAKELVREQWPPRHMDPDTVARTFSRSRTSAWTRSLLYAWVVETPGVKPRHLRTALEDLIYEEEADPPWVQAVMSVGDIGWMAITLFDTEKPEMHLRVTTTPLENHESTDITALEEIPASHGFWTPYKTYGKWLRDPTTGRMAEILRTIAEHWLGTADAFSLDEVWEEAQELPWPLRACLHRAASAQELAALADAMAYGRFGEVEDWRALHAAWEADRTIPGEAIWACDEDVPFRVRPRHPPLMPIAAFDAQAFGNHDDRVPILRQYADLALAMPDGSRRKSEACGLVLLLAASSLADEDSALESSADATQGLFPLDVSLALVSAAPAWVGGEKTSAVAGSVFPRRLTLADVEALDAIVREEDTYDPETQWPNPTDWPRVAKTCVAAIHEYGARPGLVTILERVGDDAANTSAIHAQLLMRNQEAMGLACSIQLLIAELLEPTLPDEAVAALVARVAEGDALGRVLGPLTEIATERTKMLVNLAIVVVRHPTSARAELEHTLLELIGADPSPLVLEHVRADLALL